MGVSDVTSVTINFRMGKLTDFLKLLNTKSELFVTFAIDKLCTLSIQIKFQRRRCRFSIFLMTKLEFDYNKYNRKIDIQFHWWVVHRKLFIIILYKWSQWSVINTIPTARALITCACCSSSTELVGLTSKILKLNFFGFFGHRQTFQE